MFATLRITGLLGFISVSLIELPPVLAQNRAPAPPARFQNRALAQANKSIWRVFDRAVTNEKIPLKSGSIPAGVLVKIVSLVDSPKPDSVVKASQKANILYQDSIVAVSTSKLTVVNPKIAAAMILLDRIDMDSSSDDFELLSELSFSRKNLSNPQLQAIRQKTVSILKQLDSVNTDWFIKVLNKYKDELEQDPGYVYSLWARANTNTRRGHYLKLLLKIDPTNLEGINGICQLLRKENSRGFALELIESIKYGPHPESTQFTEAFMNSLHDWLTSDEEEVQIGAIYATLQFANSEEFSKQLTAPLSKALKTLSHSDLVQLLQSFPRHVSNATEIAEIFSEKLLNEKSSDGATRLLIANAVLNIDSSNELAQKVILEGLLKGTEINRRLAEDSLFSGRQVRFPLRIDFINQLLKMENPEFTGSALRILSRVPLKMFADVESTPQKDKQRKQTIQQIVETLDHIIITDDGYLHSLAVLCRSTDEVALRNPPTAIVITRLQNDRSSAGKSRYARLAAAVAYFIEANPQYADQYHWLDEIHKNSDIETRIAYAQFLGKTGLFSRGRLTNKLLLMLQDKEVDVQVAAFRSLKTIDNNLAEVVALGQINHPAPEFRYEALSCLRFASGPKKTTLLLMLGELLESDNIKIRDASLELAQSTFSYSPSSDDVQAAIHALPQIVHLATSSSDTKIRNIALETLAGIDIDSARNIVNYRFATAKTPEERISLYQLIRTKPSLLTLQVYKYAVRRLPNIQNASEAEEFWNLFISLAKSLGGKVNLETDQVLATMLISPQAAEAMSKNDKLYLRYPNTTVLPMLDILENTSNSTIPDHVKLLLTSNCYSGMAGIGPVANRGPSSFLPRLCEMYIEATRKERKWIRKAILLIIKELSAPAPKGSDVLTNVWPLPLPTFRTTLAGFLKHNQTLQGSLDRLLELLNEKGYTHRSVLEINDGFLIITNVERIDAQHGKPFDGNARWSREKDRANLLNIGTWFRLMFSRPPGDYRMFAFVVTSSELKKSNMDGLDTVLIDKILRSHGTDRILKCGKDLVTDSTFCHVYIYRYRKAANGALDFLTSDAIQPDVHLQAAGFR
ncbi:hypothetical protein [Gimesia sp.]|uniref:hypothetical protein n=1 Tax=Gimesia sp. TaxID=2024833 RepID=UPI003A8D4250